MNLLESENREKAINELNDEIEVVLSVKDEVTEEEISNFKEEFPMLKEEDIRKAISKITGDAKYIDDFSEEKEEVKLHEAEEKEEIKVYSLKNDEEKEEYNLGDTISFDRSKLKEALKSLESASELGIKETENNSAEEKPKVVEAAKHYEYKGKPENIKVIRGEVKYSQLSIDWDWPYGVEKVLILYRNDKFPTKISDSGAVRLIVERNYGELVGQYSIHKVKEENYYFCVFPMLEENGDIIYLDGRKRLVVCKEPAEVFYNIKVKKSLFGAVKAVKIIFSSTAKEINIPPTVLISKRGSIPVFKADGEELCNFDFIKLSKDETAEIELPLEAVKKNMYVKLFLEDEGNSSMFRIIPPEKKQLYFK